MTSASSSLAALQEPLLRLLLERAINTSAQIEHLLLNVRSALLFDATDDATSPAAQRPFQNLIEQGGSRFLAALAQQSYLNEYALYETDEEHQRVAILTNDVAQHLAAEGNIPTHKLALLGAYRPLHALPFAAQILHHYLPANDDFLYRVIRLQLIGPLHDRALRHEIASLSGIDDPVSISVRQQYEENPYPRWLHLDHHEAQTVPAYLQQLFGQVRLQTYAWPDRPRVLIAGCGTGKQALSAAMRFAKSDVLGVDLSLTSLAYARRMGAELNIDNVTFRQGDLLALPTDLAPFDVIECVGVLHHLQDPAAGWRQLVARLRPGGCMRIGLYSQTARQMLEPARALVRERGFGADLAGIRAFRHHVLSGRPEDPVAAILAAADFFSTSECRDLVFHVSEQEFSLPHIAQLLQEMGLRFLGFELANDAVLEAYRERFAQDPTATDLACWAEFEALHPHIFASMYQFWVQRV
ncbi:MAG: class I SAM-dependent methyltransferase [Gammaproteobacteria bacterium]